MTLSRNMLIALCVLLVSPGFALDTFRVRSMTVINLDGQNTETQTVELGYNDSLGLIFPQNTRFLKGVEIELKIPREILAYQNSMAWGLYRNLTPQPISSTIDYQAEQIMLQPLPSRLTFILQIPLVKGHGLKAGPYATVVTGIHDPLAGPLLFRLLPVMKGLPENIDSMTFSARIKPIFADLGGLTLSVRYPQTPHSPISVRIDEQLFANPAEVLYLEPGSHHISIVSEQYRDEVRVVTVEQARITEISIDMKDTTPYLTLVAPENTKISMDGTVISNSRDPIATTPGQHLVTFTIGDYELTRQIIVEKGKDYTISLVVDVNISVSP